MSLHLRLVCLRSRALPLLGPATSVPSPLRRPHSCMSQVKRDFCPECFPISCPSVLWSCDILHILCRICDSRGTRALGGESGLFPALSEAPVTLRLLSQSRQSATVNGWIHSFSVRVPPSDGARARITLRSTARATDLKCGSVRVLPLLTVLQGSPCCLRPADSLSDSLGTCRHLRPHLTVCAHRLLRPRPGPFRLILRKPVTCRLSTVLWPFALLPCHHSLTL